MSKAFSNAFIRAYAKGAAPPQSTPIAPHASSKSESDRQPLQDSGSQDRTGSRRVHLVDQAHQPPPPHLTFVETADQSATGDSSGGSEAEIVAAETLNTDIAPELSFQCDSMLVLPDFVEAPHESNDESVDSNKTDSEGGREVPVNRPSVTAAEASSDLLPAWEVDRIVWPEICGRLYSAATEHFDQAGNQLREAAQDGLATLAICSTASGEGRTTVALSLAQAAARAGVRVALVDANTRQPELANRLRFEIESSWHDVLEGQLPLEEAAIATLEDGITLFPLAQDARVNLHDSRVSALMQRIAASHDLTIIDAPPVGGSDAAFFQGGDRCPIQAAILVQDVRRTTHDQALISVERLRQHGISAVGIAENFGPKA